MNLDDLDGIWLRYKRKIKRLFYCAMYLLNVLIFLVGLIGVLFILVEKTHANNSNYCKSLRLVIYGINMSLFIQSELESQFLTFYRRTEQVLKNIDDVSIEIGQYSGNYHGKNILI